MLNRFLATFIICTLSLIISGCGFHLPNTQSWTPAIRHIYLNPGRANRQLATAVRQTLQSYGVGLLAKPTAQQVTLHLLTSKVTTNLPVIFDSTIATTYYYIIHATYMLETHTGKPITGIRTLQVSQGIVYNANQVGEPVFTPIMRRELYTRLARLIMTSLSDQPTQQLIKQTLKHHHVTHHH